MLAALILAPVTLTLVSAGKAVGPLAQFRSLAGQLLVASPRMEDPRFTRTVIYMVRHTGQGALGVIVNRPMAEVPLARVLRDLGLAPGEVQGDVRVHYGGPVERARGLVLHTRDYAGAGTVSVKDGFSLTTEPSILRDIAGGAGPRRALFALGYAGWGPGQLDAEIDAGAWVTAPADEALLFDGDDRTKWERAMARQTIRL